MQDAIAIWRGVRQEIEDASGNIAFDLSNVHAADGGVIALLVALRLELAARGVTAELAGASNRVETIVNFCSGHEPAAEPKKRKAKGTIAQIGRATLEAKDEAKALLDFVGSMVLVGVELVRHPRAGHWKEIPLLCEKTGANALPIVLLINFLVGFVMAFQSAKQLKLFGANVYVADLVGISLTRELAPLMTAIIVCGRSGAAFAAKIGSMKVNVDVVALRPMGISPIGWLVVPRIITLIRFFANHRQVLTVPTRVGGGAAELGWALSRHLQALIGFSARLQRVDAVATPPDATLPAYNSRDGRIFLLTFNIRHDNTVAPEGLRRGVRLQVKNEVSDRYWGSQFDYSKFEVRTELYGKLAWNYPSLVLQTVCNFPTSIRGVPITEMLRIGGANLRGYLVNEFHGDTLVRAQVEDQAVVLRGLPIPFDDTRFNIAAAAFVDAAALLERHPGGTAVAPPVQSRPKLNDIHTSVGAGVRVILPGVTIPAIKIDLGYGIDLRSFAISVAIAGME